MIGVKKIKKGQIETYTTADIADSVNKRYQTDNQQTYNDATSSIQTQLNAKLESTSWIDYSATSTIVGWSSFITKEIRYKIVDNYIFIDFLLDGTSNTTTISFTAPNISTQGFSKLSLNAYAVNNGVLINTPGRVIVSNSSNIVNVYRDMLAATWSSSGQKGVAGQISFKIN